MTAIFSQKSLIKSFLLVKVNIDTKRDNDYGKPQFAPGDGDAFQLAVRAKLIVFI